MPAGPVLIVDDDFDIRDVLGQILEDEGYAVSRAANGREALEQLESGPLPSVILLDLMMPEMNGWQFRERQRSDPRWASIPVVVISADGNVREKADGVQADGYLRKPIGLDPLLETVARFASNASA